MWCVNRVRRSFNPASLHACSLRRYQHHPLRPDHEPNPMARNQNLNHYREFQLDSEFVEKYRDRPVRWGFNGLGELVYRRTYARMKPDSDEPEQWVDTCKRVIEGVFRMQQKHMNGNVSGEITLSMKKKGYSVMMFDHSTAQVWAQDMFDRMFHFKWLPAGRGLWAMGTLITEGVRNPEFEADLLQLPLYAALNNCGFVSTLSLVKSIDHSNDNDNDVGKSEEVTQEDEEEHLSLPQRETLRKKKMGIRPSVITEEGFDIGATLKDKPGTVPEPEEEYDPSEPFSFLMECSMLGIGCGFDTRGKHAVIAGVDRLQECELFVIPDSREGWCEALSKLINAHFLHLAPVSFDFSEIRPKGTPIKRFGGIAGGSEPLKKLLENVNQLLESRRGLEIGMRGIVDLMNMIGVCVVSGNVRRTAEIAFGDPWDEEYLNLKNYNKNPERMEFGWASNNSVLIEDDPHTTMDHDQSMRMYDAIAKRICDNGEPGIAWLHNMQHYGRMIDPPNEKDLQACGGNPCLEQTLWDRELCNLVETFPNNHKNLNDFKDTLTCAILYGKIVSLGDVHWEKTRTIMKQNRRIGLSMTGIQQLLFRLEKQVCKNQPYLLIGQENYDNGKIELPECHKERLELQNKRRKLAMNEFRRWCDESYHLLKYLDTHYSAMHGVCESIKLTSVKPSGSVSLLAGATPGIHWPFAEYYIRRVRVSQSGHSDLIKGLQKKGYPMEQAKEDPSGDTLVVSFPCQSSCLDDPPSQQHHSVEQMKKEDKLNEGNNQHISASFASDGLIDDGFDLVSDDDESEDEQCERVVLSDDWLNRVLRMDQAKEVSAETQLEFASLLQEHWADNQVSCTVSFDPKRESELIAPLLWKYSTRLKAVSFLPRSEDTTVYAQMPYEEISEEEYHRMMSQIDHSSGLFSQKTSDQPPSFCDNE